MKKMWKRKMKKKEGVRVGKMKEEMEKMWRWKNKKKQRKKKKRITNEGQGQTLHHHPNHFRPNPHDQILL
jgi:hypothetical protein